MNTTAAILTADRWVEPTRGYDGKGRGNCVAACLASIFGLSLAEVEEGLSDGPTANGLMAWTESRFPWLECRNTDHSENYREVEPPSDEHPEGTWTYDLPSVRPEAPTLGLWMASVVSPRGVLRHGPYRGSPILHAVVMRGGNLVWDPHPRRAEGVGALVERTWWLARDPADCVAWERVSGGSDER
jgi:hypothetical protein